MNQISNLFKNENTFQKTKKRKTDEITRDDNFEQSEITDISEKEAQLLEIFRQFTNTYNIDLLVNCPVPFNEFTDIGYSVLLRNNFFGLFSSFISQSSNMRTIPQMKKALQLLVFFSTISSDISEQILGSFNDVLNSCLSSSSYELHDLALLLCKNFSIFPTIANKFSYDQVKISYLSTIFNRSMHLNQKQEVIKIYKNLAKIDIYQYDEFIKSVLDQRYMDDILPLIESIKLLRYLSNKPSNDEKFASQYFISKLKDSFQKAILNGDTKYVKNCLKFINIRCSVVMEVISYYDLGFSPILISLPNEFMYYVSLIYIWIFEKIPESSRDGDLLKILIDRLNQMVHNGIYKDKVAAIKLISKIIYKRKDLCDNPIISGIVIDSIELIFSNDTEAVCRFLDLLIMMCDHERTHEEKKLTDSIINQNIFSMMNEMSDTENISDRLRILHNTIYVPDDNN